MDQEGLKYADRRVTFPQAMIDVYEKVREAGIQPYAISRENGGLGLPAMAQCIQMEVQARADGSFSIATLRRDAPALRERELAADAGAQPTQDALPPDALAHTR